jgi:hypothetical protein
MTHSFIDEILTREYSPKTTSVENLFRKVREPKLLTVKKDTDDTEY